jgi:hypothetical protein
MDPILLLMRALHIGLGAFWVGAIILNAVFLGPAIRDAGPDGAKVGAALMRRRMFDVMPLVAIVSMLAGIWLYWRVSGGFQTEYMRSATGMMLGFGAAASIVGFAIGAMVMRPAMMKAAALTQAAATADPSARDANLAQAQALRMRAATTGNIVAALLIIALIAMSIARYLV